MIRIPRWLTLVLVMILFVGLAGTALAEECKCKIKSIQPDRDQLVCTDDQGKTMTFKLDNNAKLRLNDRDIKLNELKEGDEVTVVYDKQGFSMIAKEVRCDRK